jgi:hypothetical protein
MCWFKQQQLNNVKHKIFGSYIFGLPTVKAIPLQALTGPEVSSRLRPPDFKTIGT